jgi:hypothetical protein
MAKAMWSTKATEIKASRDTATGTFSAAVPLYDNGVKQGTLTIAMTEDRVLRFLWDAEPGAVGLSSFSAWSTQ